MKNRNIFLLLLCLLLGLSCKNSDFKYKDYVRPVPVKQLSASEKEQLSERNREIVNTLERLQYIKDYAFCRCLSYSIGEKAKKEIEKVDASLGVLYDIGFVGPVSDAVDSLTLAYTKRTYEGQTADLGGKEAHIASCLAFIRSEELDTFIKFQINK